MGDENRKWEIEIMDYLLPRHKIGMIPIVSVYGREMEFGMRLNQDWNRGSFWGREMDELEYAHTLG